MSSPEQDSGKLLSPSNRIAYVSSQQNQGVSVSKNNLERILQDVVKRKADFKSLPVGVISVLGSNEKNIRAVYTDWLIHYFSSSQEKDSIHSWHNQFRPKETKIKYVMPSASPNPPEDGVYLWPLPYVVEDSSNNETQTIMLWILFLQNTKESKELNEFCALASTAIVVLDQSEILKIKDIFKTTKDKTNSVPAIFHASSANRLSNSWSTGTIRKSWEELFNETENMSLKTVLIQNNKMHLAAFSQHLDSIQNEVNVKYKIGPIQPPAATATHDVRVRTISQSASFHNPSASTTSETDNRKHGQASQKETTTNNKSAAVSKDENYKYKVKETKKPLHNLKLGKTVSPSDVGSQTKASSEITVAGRSTVDSNGTISQENEYEEALKAARNSLVTPRKRTYGNRNATSPATGTTTPTLKNTDNNAELTPETVADKIKLFTISSSEARHPATKISPASNMESFKPDQGDNAGEQEMNTNRQNLSPQSKLASKPRFVDSPPPPEYSPMAISYDIPHKELVTKRNVNDDSTTANHQAKSGSLIQLTELHTDATDHQGGKDQNGTSAEIMEAIIPQDMKDPAVQIPLKFDKYNDLALSCKQANDDYFVDLPKSKKDSINYEPAAAANVQDINRNELKEQLNSPFPSPEFQPSTEGDTVGSRIQTYSKAMHQEMSASNQDPMQLKKIHDSTIEHVTSGMSLVDKEELANLLDTKFLCLLEHIEEKMQTASSQHSQTYLGMFLTRDWVHVYANSGTLGTKRFHCPGSGGSHQFGFPALISSSGGNMTFGYDAVKAINENKTRLDHRGYILQYITGSIVAPDDIVKAVIANTLKAVEAAVNDQIHQLILVVPSWLTFSHRHRLRESCKAAGLRKVVMLTESSLTAFHIFKSIDACVPLIEDALIAVVIARLESVVIEVYSSEKRNALTTGVHILAIASEVWALPDNHNSASVQPQFPFDYMTTVKAAFARVLNRVNVRQRNTIGYYTLILDNDNWAAPFDQYFGGEENLSKVENVNRDVYFKYFSEFCNNPSKLSNFFGSLATSVLVPHAGHTSSSHDGQMKNENLDEEFISRKLVLPEECD